jgi:signal transduction histidine kinase
LFQAAKELLGNAIRHGRAREIIVAVHWRGEPKPGEPKPGEPTGVQGGAVRTLKIVIDDDGCGFEPARVLSPRTQRGLGLAGIRERLVSFSGKMSIESDPGRGTRIIMEVPVRNDKVTR